MFVGRFIEDAGRGAQATHASAPDRWRAVDVAKWLAVHADEDIDLAEAADQTGCRRPTPCACSAA